MYYVHKTGFCTEYNDIKNYQEAMQDCNNKNGVIHFPNEIPQKAKEPLFYYFGSGLGRHILLLKFKIDKEFINNELDKYTYKNEIDAINTVKNYCQTFPDKEQFNTDKYTFFIINKDFTKKAMQKKISAGYSGFGIDENKGCILYFYINPEG